MESPVAQQRVVRGAPALLEVFFTDQDGEPASAPTTVTVGITRGDGTELVAPLTATVDDTTNTAGRYTYALAATGTALLNWLTVTWTSGTTVLTTLVEVVGGVYFTVAQARARISSLVESDPNYSTANIVAARNVLEDEFEKVCGAAFVPRYRRVRVTPSNYRWCLLPDPLVRTVRSVTLDRAGDLTAFTAPQLAGIVIDEAGLLLDTGSFGFGYQNVIVEYEHGFARPPRAIQDVAFTRLRELVNSDTSGIPDRATSFVSVDGANFRLDTADIDGPANPEIRAVLARYDYKRLAFA